MELAGMSMVSARSDWLSVASKARLESSAEWSSTPTSGCGGKSMARSSEEREMTPESYDPGAAGPLLGNTKELPWLDLGDGLEFQLLRFSDVTGDFTLFVRMQPGARIAPHMHYGTGQFFVTRGELKYDLGNAPAGTYGFEAQGEVHVAARADELTEYFFVGTGSSVFTAEDGRVESILDWQALKKIWDEAQGR